MNLNTLKMSFTLGAIAKSFEFELYFSGLEEYKG